MKSGEHWSSGFGEEDVSRFYGFLLVYSTGARVDNPWGKCLILTKNFTSLIIHCKFKPLVLNTY